MWPLDTSVTFLNHGSFGVCPNFILERQTYYRQIFESEPVDFVIRHLDELIYRSRSALAKFIHCDTGDLVLIPNVTHGVNTVLKSYPFQQGDEVLITDHIYNACRIALAYVAEVKHLKIKEVQVRFPDITSDLIIEKVLSNISPTTKLVFLDHITSPTAIIFPVNEIIRELNQRGIDCFIDGAHAPGAIPLDINALNASFYTGNCHKWMCAPKGVGFLHVRKDKQHLIQPLVHSHFSDQDRSFPDRFHWPGTADPSAAIALPDVIEYLGNILPAGWGEMMERNHVMIIQARNFLCDSWGIQLPCPDELLSTMAAIPLGQSEGVIPSAYNEINLLQEYLFEECQIEIPVYTWPDTKNLIIRPSAQIYNNISQYKYLAECVSKRIFNS